MTQLSIKLSDKLEAQLGERATESSYTSVDQYVKNLIVADMEQSPESEIEKLLIDRLDSGGTDIEVTPAYWKKLKTAIRRKGCKGSSERV
jgi:hypothetical protein